MNKQAQHNYASPWYHLGRITGAFADPSTYLLFTKVGQSARIFGTAFTAEEIAKQQLQENRPDSYLPFVAAGGYAIPFVVNKLAKGSVPASVQQNIIKADNAYNQPPKQITQQIYEDGKFIDPNKSIGKRCRN